MDRAFVSQPALTKAIQWLEQTVGGHLFDRVKTPVLPTALGQAMLPSLRHIHDSAVTAPEQVRGWVRSRRHAVLPGFVESQDGHKAVDLSFREGKLELLTDAAARSI